VNGGNGLPSKPIFLFHISSFTLFYSLSLKGKGMTPFSVKISYSKQSNFSIESESKL
jgi:hypothetical protein